MTDPLFATFLLLFSMGLMGSLHCIGMCGGLVSALTLSRERVLWSGLIFYQFGRVTTYAMLGLVVGFAGEGLHAIGGSFLQAAVAVFAGLAMVIFALNLGGWLPDPVRHLTAWASSKIGMAQLASAVRSSHRGRSWFLLGLANGLLPCGLVYAALWLAVAAGHSWNAMVMMTSFGLGTVPAMLAAPVLLHKLTSRLRVRVMRWAAVLMLLLGILTIYRSVMHVLSAAGTMS